MNTPVQTKDARKNLPADARQLIANARNDITIPFYSGALQHVDDTLIQRGGGKGLKIYDEIERDTHAFSMLQKRKKTLLRRDWTVEAASDRPIDIEAADFVRKTLKTMPFDRICEDLLDATLKGFAITEIVWKRSGNRIVPDKLVSHDQRRFAFGEDWQPRLLTWANMQMGEALPERKFIVHRHGVKGNNPYGLGLGTRLFWPVLFKREGVAFWLHFLDKYAEPTVVGSTPYGTINEEQRKLLNTLSSIRSSSAVTVPIGTDVKFLEAARAGSVTYQDFLTYWDKQISICVNGETLTTDVGSAGSRAASETHADILEALVDSDGDLLASTLKEQFLSWLVEYNFPGAITPDIWRERPENRKAAAEARKARGEAAEQENSALTAVIITAAHIDDDDAARELITGTGLTEHLSDTAIDRLVEARFAFMEGGKRGRDARQLMKDNPAFAVGALKKKLHDHVCFADADDPITRLTGRVEAAAERHFDRRLDAIRSTLDAVTDLPAAARAILELAVRWAPDALGKQFGEALELVALIGREDVYLDGESPADFAGADVFSQPFREQIDFLRQKRGKPTKAWTGAMRGVHDRAFAIAGATDMAMLGDFQNALADAMENGGTLEAFRKDFDAIVTRYGWQYKGKRGWRTRVIFETNMRTSYMAGRLKQMRDPDVLKLRPFWQYRHGETRKPKIPRPQHQAWHGLVLWHDDPFWETHFPPNDWLCSCGVRSLSERDLKRMGKEGPDSSPEPLMEPVKDPVTGKLVEQPQGVGYGWDYQPGHLWEQGLVPSALIDEAGGIAATSVRHAVLIDDPEPLDGLLKRAKPFKAKPMKEGLEPEDYVRAFLKPFGGDIGKAVLFEDKAGVKVPVSELLFRDRRGELKVSKRARGELTPLLAETLMDPDEIWLGVIRKVDPGDRTSEELLVDRRYIRVDPKTRLVVVFEIGEKFWEAVTAYRASDLKSLDRRRGGKLIYKRSEK